MSTGNKFIDDQIAAAAASLSQKWWNPHTARQSQPENELHPDTSQLQFRIKLLEDRVSKLEKLLNVR